MNIQELFSTKNSRGAWAVFLVCILIAQAAFVYERPHLSK